MKLKTKIRYINILILAILGYSLLLTFFTPKSVSAFDSTSSNQCNNSMGYPGNVTVKSGVYDIYLKLGIKGKSYSSTVFVSDIDGNGCKQIGHLDKASGYKWQKVGEISADSKQTLTLTLDSSSINNIPDANRPSILIVSKDHKVCRPTDECRLEFSGKSAYLRPSRTSLTLNSLPIYLVSDPKKDTVTKVEYFIDNEYAYTESSLKELDKRYVPIGRHKISTVINFKSGQKIIIPSTTNQSISSGFKNFVLSLFLRNRSFLQIILSILLIILFITLILHILRALYKKYLWRITHDATQPSQISQTVNSKIGSSLRVTEVSKKALPYIVGAVFIVGTISAVQKNGIKFVKVSGMSMQNTLMNNDTMMVSKFNKWWSNFNGQEYTPKRGQVVIVRTEDSVYDESTRNSGTSFVVKRVIGLPGERVVAKDNVITVYSKQKPKGFNPDRDAAWAKTMVYEASDLPVNIDIRLKESELFLAGDNRPGSTDSRVYGPVDTSNVYGKVIARVLPIKKLKGVGL
jgi:signal peptidase I